YFCIRCSTSTATYRTPWSGSVLQPAEPGFVSCISAAVAARGELGVDLGSGFSKKFLNAIRRIFGDTGDLPHGVGAIASPDRSGPAGAPFVEFHGLVVEMRESEDCLDAAGPTPQILPARLRGRLHRVRVGIVIGVEPDDVDNVIPAKRRGNPGRA